MLGLACPNRLETTITGMPLLSVKAVAVSTPSWIRGRNQSLFRRGLLLRKIFSFLRYPLAPFGIRVRYSTPSYFEGIFFYLVDPRILIRQSSLIGEARLGLDSPLSRNENVFDVSSKAPLQLIWSAGKSPWPPASFQCGSSAICRERKQCFRPRSTGARYLPPMEYQWKVPKFFYSSALRSASAAGLRVGRTRDNAN
jgi:hypothetical protein